jgi:predicted SAM-dependent methyltransferase
MIRDVLPEKWLDLYDSCRFEIRCSLSRLSAARQDFSNIEQYLHLGCGGRILPGFINTDVIGSKNVLGVDLRFPFPFKDNSFRGVYAHHVLEHLEYTHARQVLRECFRVLDKGGTLRLAVPDVRKAIRLYVEDPINAECVSGILPSHHRSAEWKSSLEVIDYLFRDRKFNRHLSAWDEPTFKMRLLEAGSSTVQAVSCGVSRDPKLSELDNEAWKDHSLYVEANK